MYIGDKKIKSKTEDGNDIVVTLEDKTVERLHKDVFQMVATKKRYSEPASTHDLKTHKVATKFLVEMGDYHFDLLEANTVAQKIQTLLVNVRDDAIAKKFKCDGVHAIPVSAILDAELNNNETDK